MPKNLLFRFQDGYQIHFNRITMTNQKFIVMNQRILLIHKMKNKRNTVEGEFRKILLYDLKVEVEWNLKGSKDKVFSWSLAFQQRNIKATQELSKSLKEIVPNTKNQTKSRNSQTSKNMKNQDWEFVQLVWEKVYKITKTSRFKQTQPKTMIWLQTVNQLWSLLNHLLWLNNNAQVEILPTWQCNQVRVKLIQKMTTSVFLVFPSAEIIVNLKRLDAVLLWALVKIAMKIRCLLWEERELTWIIVWWTPIRWEIEKNLKPRIKIQVVKESISVVKKNKINKIRIYYLARETKFSMRTMCLKELQMKIQSDAKESRSLEKKVITTEYLEHGNDIKLNFSALIQYWD